jgi:hypothetical protein
MEVFAMDTQGVRQILSAVSFFISILLPVYAIAGNNILVNPNSNLVNYDAVQMASISETQPIEHTHDLAIVSIIAPKKVTLSSKKPTVVKTVKVAIQNRSPYIETIPDQNTLKNLISLSVVPNGAGSSCPTPLAVLRTGKPLPVLPVTLKPNKKLKIVFDVAFSCALDPMKGSGHEDFHYIAQIDASALDGQEDVIPASDVCPRSPIPVVDGSEPDKGCGGKLPSKILGGPVLSDVVLKKGGEGSSNTAPSTGGASLSWVAPVSKIDGSPLSLGEIAGYRIYHGITSGNLTLLHDLGDGSAMDYTVTGLTSGTHYFAVTAYDYSENESGYSDIVSKTIP